MADTISFNEWQKLDLRVARIIDIKEHPNADKLYLLDVDLGNEKRQLVAGLKNNYSPDELKGKLCVVFTNLKPATIRGAKSEGMVLAAVNEDKSKVFILQPEKEIGVGSRIS
nr:methionine--tRNA ligase [uncultured archaeon]